MVSLSCNTKYQELDIVGDHFQPFMGLKVYTLCNSHLLLCNKLPKISSLKP